LTWNFYENPRYNICCVHLLYNSNGNSECSGIN